MDKSVSKPRRQRAIMVPAAERIVGWREAATAYGVHESTLHRFVRAGIFPKPAVLSVKRDGTHARVGWLLSVVEAEVRKAIGRTLTADETMGTSAA